MKWPKFKKCPLRAMEGQFFSRKKLVCTWRGTMEIEKGRKTRNYIYLLVRVCAYIYCCLVILE